jgi:hypothetical protein
MFGVPQVILTDNGPQYIGESYRTLMKDYDILHITSSPHHPQSHGFIERMVETVKALIKKSPRATAKALLAYRTTPQEGQNQTPAELLFGRKILSNLPIHIQGKYDDACQLKRDEKQTKLLEKYDQRSKELEELHMGQPVFYQDIAKRTWSPGIVLGVGPKPRSYTVQCSQSGRSMERNRHLLRPRKVQFNFEDTTQDTLVNHKNNHMSQPRCTPVTSNPDTTNRQSQNGTHMDRPVTQLVSDDKSQESSNRERRPRPETVKTAQGQSKQTTRSGRLVKTPKRYKQ